MALARNLNRNNKPKLKAPKLKKWVWIVLILLLLGFAGYGILNLSRVTPVATEKQELKLETGDRPIPQKTVLFVTADDGLFMREKPEPKASILILVPNGTKLEADEVEGEWYKVSYMDKSGWVNKNFVTTQAPAEDPTKSWKTFVNKEFGYSFRYPTEWVAQDYGANPASNSLSYVGVGAQLAPALDPAKLPPIVVRVTADSKDKVENTFKGAANSVGEAVTVSGIAATKYGFNSSVGVQMTAYVISKGSQTMILEESGGFSDELGKMVAGLNLG